MISHGNMLPAKITLFGWASAGAVNGF